MHMSTAADRTGGATNWFRRAEAWLDAHGKSAWIAAMVLSFIFIWPLGLAFIAYITITHRWSMPMFGQSCRDRRHARHDQMREHAREWAREWGRPDRTAYRPSGNTSFDAYKADTLRRLEDEQEAFETFLQRLRAAKDKTEFDNFMDDRARASRDMAPADGSDPATPGPASAPTSAPTPAPRQGEY